MGKQAYVGVSGVARKIKKAYVGVEGIAHRIRRCYVGDNDGKARLCWGSGEIIRGGTAEKLSSDKLKYGCNFSDSATFVADNKVEKYNNDLTKSVMVFSDLLITDSILTHNEKYLVSAGGIVNAYNESDAVYAIDESFVSHPCPVLSQAKNKLSGSSLNNLVFFAGGSITGSQHVSKTVDVYDDNLTKSTGADLSIARRYLASSMVGNHVIFAGGAYGSPYSNSDAYDESLTRTSITSLNVSRCYLKGGKVSNYAIFAGGRNMTYPYTYYDYVDVYDKNLTKFLGPSLFHPNSPFSSLDCKNNSFFLVNDVDYKPDVYDENLTHFAVDPVTGGLSNVLGAYVNDIILIGNNYAMDVYEIM